MSVAFLVGDSLRRSGFTRSIRARRTLGLSGLGQFKPEEDMVYRVQDIPGAWEYREGYWHKLKDDGATVPPDAWYNVDAYNQPTPITQAEWYSVTNGQADDYPVYTRGGKSNPTLFVPVEYHQYHNNDAGLLPYQFYGGKWHRVPDPETSKRLPLPVIEITLAEWELYPQGAPVHTQDPAYKDRGSPGEYLPTGPVTTVISDAVNKVISDYTTPATAPSVWDAVALEVAGRQVTTKHVVLGAALAVGAVALIMGTRRRG